LQKLINLVFLVRCKNKFSYNWHATGAVPQSKTVAYENHPRLVWILVMAGAVKIDIARHEYFWDGIHGHSDTLQNAITATDYEIDRLVYDLYGLTEDEIKLVEESSANNK